MISGSVFGVSLLLAGVGLAVVGLAVAFLRIKMRTQRKSEERIKYLLERGIFL